ncbi:MAG: hypothetical protein AABX38_06840 [Candidatus Micrarchaeota archaeon]
MEKKPLVKTIIIHDKCSKAHIDKGKWATFNHSRHLCEYCKEFFFVKKANVGISKEG